MSEDGKVISVVEQTARKWLLDRGVKTEDIAKLVYHLQEKYHPNLKIEDCLYNVERVIPKREVQNAILTGIQLDILAEKGMLEEPLQSIVAMMKGFMASMKF